MHCVYGDDVCEPFDFDGQIIHNLVLDDLFFTATDVKKLLLLINPNKSMEPDEVHPRILKESADVIYFPLYCILRQSFDQCKLPDI